MGRRLLREPLPAFADMRPRFDTYLTLLGRSVVTVDGHCDAMRRITSHLNTTHPTTEAVDRYVVDLYRSTFSYSHKVNTVQALEHWLAFLGEPRRFGRQRKPRRLIKQPPTEMEINRLFLACRTIKETAVLAILAYAPLRPKELCFLRRQDVDLARRTVFVSLGKGHKDRLVDIPSACVEAVLQYLAEHPRAPGDYLFTTYQGNRYTTGAARKFMKVLARRAGYDRRLWPYAMRHAYITNAALRGAPGTWLQRQAGHAWFETTQVYFDSITAQAFEVTERLFPKYQSTVHHPSL